MNKVRKLAGSPFEPGRREQNKLAKAERIREATSSLFKKHGYSSATMRQIALRAHVGLGTLFNYAEDKRDLIFFVFNQELAELTEAALAADGGNDLIGRLLAIYRCHYDYFGSKPELSRILLQELTFYSSGKQAEAFLQTRRRLIDGIEAIVRTAQRKGEIESAEDAQFIARHLFFVYSAAIRWWIAGARPDANAGLADLRRLLELQVRGLAPLAKRKTSRSSRTR
ncbi:MAG: TetR/AcrR family transcriptional regulator [Betaproteobacteria bacterium]|nr:TetR/AcrR family transcriptional regulator [Betaproteobacteria bacterium]